MVGSAMLSTVLSRTTTSRLTTRTDRIRQRFGCPSSVGAQIARGARDDGAEVGAGGVGLAGLVTGGAPIVCVCGCMRRLVAAAPCCRRPGGPVGLVGRPWSCA